MVNLESMRDLLYLCLPRSRPIHRSARASSSVLCLYDTVSCSARAVVTRTDGVGQLCYGVLFADWEGRVVIELIGMLERGCALARRSLLCILVSIDIQQAQKVTLHNGGENSTLKFELSNAKSPMKEIRKQYGEDQRYKDRDCMLRADEPKRRRKAASPTRQVSREIFHALNRPPKPTDAGAASRRAQPDATILG